MIPASRCIDNGRTRVLQRPNRGIRFIPDGRHLCAGLRIDIAPDHVDFAFGRQLGDSDPKLRFARWIPDHAFTCKLDAITARETHVTTFRLPTVGIGEVPDTFGQSDERRKVDERHIARIAREGNDRPMRESSKSIQSAEPAKR